DEFIEPKRVENQFPSVNLDLNDQSINLLLTFVIQLQQIHKMIQMESVSYTSVRMGRLTHSHTHAPMLPL
ncbi:hypothetical protein RDWZM_000065, partial [Blomia tropicalis]